MNEEILNPEDQTTWAKIIDDSIFTVRGVANKLNINSSQLRKYLILENKPRKRNMERIVLIMKDLKQQKRPQKHHSFGYATPQEIERLSEIGIGEERDRIFRDIAKRTKLKGKKT